MKQLIHLFLIIILISNLMSCRNSDSKTATEIVSEPISNFSDVNYEDAPNISYFSDIKRLPKGFTLGDFQDYNSILYLTESANIFPIDDKNLKLFLTDHELESVFETFNDSSYTDPIIRKVRYYPHERLVTENYVLLLINRRNNYSQGRDYTFIVRTYDFVGNIISSMKLAVWNDEKGEYYSGMIMPNMKIKIEYAENRQEYFEVQKNGKITK